MNPQSRPEREGRGFREGLFSLCCQRVEREPFSLELPTCVKQKIWFLVWPQLVPYLDRPKRHESLHDKIPFCLLENGIPKVGRFGTVDSLTVVNE